VAGMVEDTDGEESGLEANAAVELVLTGLTLLGQAPTRPSGVSIKSINPLQQTRPAFWFCTPQRQLRPPRC
jgi:hypothetical protein